MRSRQSAQRPISRRFSVGGYLCARSLIVLMLIGAVALFIAVLSAGGGATRIVERLNETKPALAS